MTDYEAAEAAFAARIDALGLSIVSEFVPFSQSRNAKEKHPSLNWRITLQRNGLDILTTDYTAGCAWCPSYVPSGASREAVAHECEHGFAAWHMPSLDRYSSQRSKPILPDTANVIGSLVNGADVLNYSTYEEWAGEFGFDPDSRKGEATYRACLEIALKLRVAIGDAELQALAELAREF